MKLGVVIEESQVLQTHLNLMSDLAGSLVRMLSTMSCGRSLFLRRRIGASLVCDIFQRKSGETSGFFFFLVSFCFY